MGSEITGTTVDVVSRDARTGGPGALTGRAFGGFVLHELVGAGGFGDVYLASQVALGREAVVKVLRPENVDETRIQRFLREAQLASRLDHPYAAHIYAFGAEDDGVFWIAMERVRGASLRAVLEAQGPMPLERFVPLLERICEVVHTAHEQGIVHRDLKPDNVMVISRAGRILPKLLDFGIARKVGLDAPLAGAPALDSPQLAQAAASTTHHGVLLGSPPYMAPELWVDPSSAGPPADQYALGALAFEALTGRRAFSGRTVLEIAHAHARLAAPSLEDAFPRELALVIQRALAKRKEDRFANVLELAQAFRDAAGVRAAAELPQLDEELRARYLAGAPQPLAEAIAGYDAARNVHQAREALRAIVRIAAWYVGVLALASHTRVGGGTSERARALLRDLRRQGLSPAGWVAVAKQLTQPFVRLPDTYPLPELVLVLHGDSDAFAPVLEGSLAEPLADSSDEAASQAVARELPQVIALLRALEFLLQYDLVVATGGRVEARMGVAAGSHRSVAVRRPLADGRPALVDAAGSPLVQLWPLVQVHAAVPGHPDQVFLLAGPGRNGARLLSALHGFEHGDPELWEWFRTQLLETDDRDGAAPAPKNPYRGLAAYGRDDATWFFGRERETEVLINRLRLEPVVVVVGPSGVGKSSLVHAGVAPAFDGWRVASLRPGRTPCTNLVAQLANAEREVDAPGVLVVVDQFEELFTLGASRDERERFVRILLDAAPSVDARLRVVLTLRDDFLIRAEQVPGLAAVLDRGLQLVGPLTPEALRRILVEPARLAGYDFEDPELPAEMVAEVADTPTAVALASFTASRLWELRDRHFQQLPRKAYVALGGVVGALAQHADDTLDAMPPAERALVRKAFRHLVTTEGTRAVLERDELLHLIGDPAAERVVERLIEARLLSTRENERGAGTVEIVHEALLTAWPRLAEWRHEDIEGARFHEQLRAAARQWHERGRPRGLLWRGDALAEYELWRRRQRQPLTELEAAFGDASVSDARRGRRLRRIAIAIAVAATAVFVTMQWRANRAEQQARRAAERLLRDSIFEEARLLAVQGDKVRALPKLATAYEMGETGDAVRLMIEEGLRSTRPRRAVLEGHTGNLWDVAISPDGKWIATGAADHTARVWSGATGAPAGVIELDADVQVVAFHPGSRLVAAGGREQIRVWDVVERRVVASIDKAAGRRIAFSPDGTTLLGSGQRGVELWRVPGFEPSGQIPEPNATARYCGSGSCIATWTTDGKIAVWDARTLARRWEKAIEAQPGKSTVDHDGTMVVIGTARGDLHVVRSDGTVIDRPGAHAESIWDVALSPDATLIATASDDDTVRVWDAATVTLRATLAGARGNVTAVEFSPDGKMLATASADGVTRLWDVRGAPLGELAGHTNIVFDLAFSRDGTRLATAGWDRRGMIWDVAAALQVSTIDQMRLHGPARFDPRPPVAFDRNGDGFAMVAADGAAVILRNGSRCRVNHASPVVEIALVADWIAWFEAGARVAHLGDARTCAAVRAVELPAEIVAIALGPRGELAVVASDGAVLVHDAGGAEIARWSESEGKAIRVSFHPDGSQLLVVLESPSQIAARPIQNPGGGRVMRAGAAGLTDVLVDPRRHQILAASLDHKVWVWDERTGATLRTLDGSGPLWGVRRSADGRFVVAVGGVSAPVFDAETGQRVGALEGHNAQISGGGFLSNQLFVTSANDGTGHVWDLHRQRPILAIGDTRAVAVSPDGRTVLLRGDHVTRLWKPELPALGVQGMHDLRRP